MNKQDSKSLQALLDKRPIITIIPHTSPDGDAIGSTLGLYHFLKNQGHDVQVIAPTDFPDFLKSTVTAEASELEILLFIL